MKMIWNAKLAIPTPKSMRKTMKTHNVLQAIQTQEEDTTPPTLASRDEPEIITISQNVNGDPERDTTKQTDETISATQDHLEPCPLHQTLTQDESKKVRQPKEKDEKHGKRARKRTKSHKAEKSTTVTKARKVTRSKSALEPTRPLQPESSSGPPEPQSCHDWGPPHLILLRLCVLEPPGDLCFFFC